MDWSSTYTQTVIQNKYLSFQVVYPKYFPDKETDISNNPKNHEETLERELVIIK